MITIGELEEAVAARLQSTGCRVTRLDVSCANPVYRADLADGRRAFLKLGDPDEMRNAAKRLSEMLECPFVPRVLIAPSADFAGGQAVCLEWKDCQKIEVVDLSDAEADSLVDGVLELSRALQRVTEIPPTGGEDDPDRQYKLVCDFAQRHPLARPVLRDLLSIPLAARSYGTRPLRIIHGDFHALNFGFSNGRFATVFDFDSIAWGLPCEDLAYALCEDMRRSGFGARRRARLLDLFARFRARSPWPADDWLLAVNHVRLRIVARRLVKHPRNPLVAFDVMRRDRMLRPLVAACC